MAGKSVGTLSMFINADAAGLMKTFNQVDRRLARWSSGITKPGAKLALGFLGVENALKAVSNEVRYVIQNIEQIPGVPAETVATIIGLRDNLASAKGWIDRMTAGMVSFGVQAAQAVGATAAAMAGHNDVSGLSRQETPEEVARAKDPAYDLKIDAARKKLHEAERAANLSEMSEAKQIVELRKEAERFGTFSESKSIDPVQKLNAQAEAQERNAKANAKMAALNRDLAKSEEQVRKSMTGVYTATNSRADAIAGLENRSQRLFYEIAESGNDPEGVEKRIKLNNELAEVQERLGNLYEKQGELAREAAVTISSGFEDAVLSGNKLSVSLRQLGMDLARMIFRSTITSPLGSWIGSGIKGMMGIPAADGGYRDGSKPYLVGEEGPEIFNPGRSGTITPNHRIGGSGGGSVVVNQSYNIGAGVTAQQLMPILAMQKRDLLATLADARRRGTAGAFA